MVSEPKASQLMLDAVIGSIDGRACKRVLVASLADTALVSVSPHPGCRASLSQSSRCQAIVTVPKENERANRLAIVSRRLDRVTHRTILEEHLQILQAIFQQLRRAGSVERCSGNVDNGRLAMEGPIQVCRRLSFGISLLSNYDVVLCSTPYAVNLCQIATARRRLVVTVTLTL